MPFDFTGAPIAVRSDITEALRKEWSLLAVPGTWWSGADRVAIAAEARAAMESLTADRAASRPASILGDGVPDVVRMVAASSPHITAEWVAGLPADGLEIPAYVEIIGIVARLSAVDLFHLALGLPLEPLPLPQPGEPSRRPPPSGLIVGKSFVPMVEPVSIPQTVSLVPPETVAWQELSDAMYMTMHEMGDPDYSGALHRTQIELVAARTSQINECFYWVLAHASMLSWSADTKGIVWNPRSITDPTIDPLLDGGRELVAFVDAAHGSDAAALTAARVALRDSLGDAATVDAAGVLGNFNQMNRLADATGMPVGLGSMRRTEELRAATGIERFYAHTP